MNKILLIFTCCFILLVKHTYAQEKFKLAKRYKRVDASFENKKKVIVKLEKQTQYPSCDNAVKTRALKKCLQKKISSFLTTKLKELVEAIHHKLLASSDGRCSITFSFKTDNKGKLIQLYMKNYSKTVEYEIYPSKYEKSKFEAFDEAAFVTLNQLNKLKLKNISGHITISVIFYTVILSN